MHRIIGMNVKLKIHLMYNNESRYNTASNQSTGLASGMINGV